MKDVQISKTLSWILRHGAKEVNLRMDAEGYVSLDAILSLPQMRGVTTEDVRRIVRENQKQRFALKEDEQEGRNLLIKANQGHSLRVENLELKEIVNPDEYPTVVHGSFYKNWRLIKVQGLSRMTRQHIHFAQSDVTNQVVSGMRNDCDLFIYVDLAKALSKGYKFYVSPNGVVLCPGNDEGFLPTEFFKQVYRLVNGQRTLSELE